MRDSIVLALGRDYLVTSLSLCTEEQVIKFKRIYGRRFGQRSIPEAEAMDLKDVIAEIPENKIEWAMQQVQATVLLNGGKSPTTPDDEIDEVEGDD